MLGGLGFALDQLGHLGQQQEGIPVRYDRLRRGKRRHVTTPRRLPSGGRTNPCAGWLDPGSRADPDNGEGRSTLAPAPPFTSGFYFRST